MVHNLNLFCKKKHTFSILHTYFYKRSTSIYLLYTLFYINNIFLFYFSLTLKLSASLFSLTHKFIPQSLYLSLIPQSLYIFFFFDSSKATRKREDDDEEDEDEDDWNIRKSSAPHAFREKKGVTDFREISTPLLFLWEQNLIKAFASQIPHLSP